MSRENVDIVRRLYEASARRDADTVLALYDPDVAFDVTRPAWGRLLSAGVYHGHDGLREFMRIRNEVWESISADLQELLDFGDQVLSVETTRARGRASGVEVEMEHAGVWTIRDGRVVKVVWFGSRGEAVAAIETDSGKARS